MTLSGQPPGRAWTPSQLPPALSIRWKWVRGTWNSRPPHTTHHTCSFTRGSELARPPGLPAGSLQGLAGLSTPSLESPGEDAVTGTESRTHAERQAGLRRCAASLLWSRMARDGAAVHQQVGFGEPASPASAPRDELPSGPAALLFRAELLVSAGSDRSHRPSLHAHRWLSCEAGRCDKHGLQQGVGQSAPGDIQQAL